MAQGPWSPLLALLGAPALSAYPPLLRDKRTSGAWFKQPISRVRTPVIVAGGHNGARCAGNRRSNDGCRADANHLYCANTNQVQRGLRSGAYARRTDWSAKAPAA